MRFTRRLISSETFEAVGVFDVDNDGVLDIVTPGYWYRGPDFREKFVIAADLARVRDYYDEFSVIPMDVDFDGNMDFVTGGWWGNALRWRKNPGKAGHEFGWGMRPWTVHVAADNTGPIETTRAWDVDGDGAVELAPNTPHKPLCVYKLSGPGVFTRHVISETPTGHGLGFGVIDGAPAFVCPKGILVPGSERAPLSVPWRWLDGPELPADSSVPILVVDIDGDGSSELIVGHAHSYGLRLYKRGAGGKWTWEMIDDTASQYHDLAWADLDGDGKPELVTGKRYLAHCGHDPGEYDDLGVYRFKWTGAGFEKRTIAYGPPGVGKGCGIAFALADLRGTGRLDLLAPGKDGLAAFFNEG